jgi:tRNA threonylcarbamoyladenosine biosynthesis protein TsaB
MRILAIETALLGGSVAMLERDTEVGQQTLDVQRRTAQTLLPAVKNLLESAGWSPRDIQLVAVSVGPGSFTGLRMGVTAAKVFAYATGAQVLGVSSLGVLADQVRTPAEQLWAVMDAERHQLFAARFRRRRDEWVEDEPVQIVDQAQWLAGLLPGMLVTGPSLAELRGQLAPGVSVAPDEVWRPRASTVGRLAFRLHQAGHRADVWSLAPHYLRPSAAEEKGAAGAPPGGIARP